MNWYKTAQLQADWKIDYSWTPEERNFLVKLANSIQERNDNLVKRRVRYNLTDSLFSLDIQERLSVDTQKGTFWQDNSRDIAIEKFEPSYYEISGTNVRRLGTSSFDQAKEILKDNI